MAIQHTLYISATRLKKDTALGGSVDDNLIMPYILLAQDMYILPILGTDLDNKLKSEIQAGTLAGAYKTLVDDYIGDMLPGYSLYHALPYLRFKVENGNIYSKTSETGTALSTEEAQHFREEVLNTASYYRERLIDYIRNNTSSFPEYSTNSGADVDPSVENYYAGMNLEKPIQGSKLTLRDFLSAGD